MQTPAATPKPEPDTDFPERLIPFPSADLPRGGDPQPIGEVLTAMGFSPPEPQNVAVDFDEFCLFTRRLGRGAQ